MSCVNRAGLIATPISGGRADSCVIQIAGITFV
jgi:hypothetical protein